MNVSAPVSFSPGAPATVTVTGNPGSVVDIIVDGEGCSVLLTVTIGANGKGTGFYQVPRCLGASVFIVARDNAGKMSRTATFGS